jgi:hypothetical protein
MFSIILIILINFIVNRFVASRDSLLSICFHSSSTWIQKSWKKISPLSSRMFIAQNHDGQNLSLEGNI